MKVLTKEDLGTISAIIDEKISKVENNILSEIKSNTRSLMNQILIEFKEAVQNELKSLVMVEMTKEEINQEEYKKTGKIIPTGKKKTEKVNLLYDMAAYIAGIEGAWRGYQADIGKLKNNVMKSNMMIESQNKNIVHFLQNVYQRLPFPTNVIETTEVKKIEEGNNGNNT